MILLDLKQIGFQSFSERYEAHLDFEHLVRHVLPVPANLLQTQLVFTLLESIAFQFFSKLMRTIWISNGLKTVLSDRSKCVEGC